MKPSRKRSKLGSSRWHSIPFLMAACMTFSPWLGEAATLSPAFTYQGRLTDGGTEATGNYDLEIRLYAVETGGSQVGPTVTRNGVEVDHGLFSLSLDFGSGPFDGTSYWVEIAVRPAGSGAAYVSLAPRQKITPTPYALFAGNAASAISASTAATASSVAVNGVGGSALQNNSVTALKIANGEVVKSLNGLKDAVSLLAGPNLTITSAGNVITLSSATWSLGGNAGVPANSFLGTLDDKPLELRSYNQRALQLDSVSKRIGTGVLFFGTESSINLIGGYAGNSIDSGVIGGTIAGGGYLFSGFALIGTDPNTPHPNRVSGDFGTVGGGYDNISGAYGTIPGGAENNALGRFSFAAGRKANALHDGSFVWGDGTGTANSTGPNRFEVLATGGANFYLGNSAMGLNSPKGISLNAGDSPMITRGWDMFDSSAGDKAGLGRWGLFMEYATLVVGIPELAGRGFEIARFATDGSRTPLLRVEQNGDARWSGSYLTVIGAGNEQAYLGGDGSGGDVQIGSMNPGISAVALWNVAGGRYMDLYVRSLRITGGADLAEPFQMSEEALTPGSVVVIDEEHPGKLKRSNAAYDQRVAGIVSGAKGVHPGIQVEQQGVLDGGQNVALTGRVYVLADATQAAIKPGDLLTTSAIPGHAMKVVDPARGTGAILGKAMTGLTSGQGHVLVLVSLQ